MKLFALAAIALLGGALASPIDPVRDPATPVVTAPFAAVTLPAGLDPAEVYIQSISYGGTGCPQGSVGTSLSNDRHTFTLIFDVYVATVGPGIAVAEGRKNCQINVNLHYPGGFQYSLFTADYRGFVELDAKVTGLQKATYYFAGSSAQASTETTFTGPISKDYLIHDEIPFSSTVWSPCGAVEALNINSQIRLDNTANKTANGYLTSDSIDGHVTFIVGVQWQACTK
ncbi:secreted protein [Peziza echinospora]|nr:secreted protein [Peziza echinospora]